MSLPQQRDTVNDPTNDPRVEKMERVYKQFLETLEGLNKEQRQVIAEAMTELNHRQIEAIRSQLTN
jgi:uncharacterized protein Smg (DUF494 family)